MGFLNAAMAAAQEQQQRAAGHEGLPGGGGSACGGGLKELLSRGTETLADVLRDAGAVPPHLRDVVLHGIAMCDRAQEGAGSREGGRCGATTSGAGAMSAGEGVAALRLMAESMSRFGGPGAFMVPSWGCGSLPEAFVRSMGVNVGSP